MHVCLIVPGPLATASGGHTYDRRMAEGLRALGHDVQVVELEGRLPDADQAPSMRPGPCGLRYRRGVKF